MNNSPSEAKEHSARVDGETNQQAERRARRIVACVNFCAGVPTETMGDLKPLRMLADLVGKNWLTIQELQSQLADLKRENEELKVERNRLGKFKSSSDAYQKQVESLKAQNAELSQQVDVKSNQLLNISDTCRVRGFPASLSTPLDERVIQMVQKLERENAELKAKGENKI